MEYLLLSFFAGILTILAPCVLPVLPIILGGSLSSKNWQRPLVITLSLGGSIVFFTLLLQLFFANTIDPSLIKWFSGGIIMFFAFTLLCPDQWSKLSGKLNFGSSSQKLLQKAGQKKGIFGDFLMGAALGPVFASCSPTYFLILGTVLPQSFVVGTINLVAYGLGLSMILFAVALLGQRLTKKMRKIADPKSMFKKVLGVIFMIVGLSIALGLDKDLEAFILDHTNFSFQLIEFEERLIEKIEQ